MISVVAFAAMLAAFLLTSSAQESPDDRHPQSVLAFLLGGDAVYPNGPITLMAPAAPGGGWDRIARLVQHIYVTEDLLGVPVEVENRGGAGGTIGLTEVVTQHRRNPYTLMIGGKTLVSAVLLHRSRFTIDQATPLALLATEYSVVAVPADSPYKTMEDLIADFRANPDRFVWGGGAAGGADHLLIGQIAKSVAVDPSSINFVAYSGGGQSATALLSKQVNAAVGGPEWRDLATAGRVRFLAVSSPERLSGYSIPTLRESGIDVAMDNWRFIIAPPGISDADREVLIQSLQRMRESAEWPRLLDNLGLVDVFLTGDELNEFLAQEVKDTALLLKELKIGEDGIGYAAAGPWLFPTATLALTVLFSILLAWSFAKKHAPAHRSQGPSRADHEEVVQLPWRPFLLSATLILVFIAMLGVVGFLFAAPAYFVAQTHLIGSRQLRRDMIVAIGLTTTIYFVFERILSINLP